MLQRRLTTAVLLCACGVALHARRAAAAAPTAPAAVTAEDLDRSIELARQYLLSAQRADGSMVYELDAARGAEIKSRNLIREVGGLWALAVLHRHDPQPATAAAVARGIKHHAQNAKRMPG